MTNKNRKEAVKEYFSIESKRWDDVYKAGDSIFNYEMQKRKDIVFDFINKRFSDKQNKNAIDVGCGAGHYIKGLLELGFQTFGSDISNTMIETTAQNLNKFNFDTSRLFCSDCEKIPMPDKYFDLVICIGVLSYAENEVNILKELKRIAKEDGLIIISVPNMIKLRNLLDPYYYLVRVWKFLFNKIFRRKKQVQISDLNEYLHNKSFQAQNRYLLKDIYRLAKLSSLEVRDIQGYVYFNPTFFRKQIFSDKTVIRINKYLENRIRNKKSRFLLNFPFGWVICLEPGKSI